MDQRLITWARQVKQRRKTSYPTLWLFTDAQRLPNPLPVIARLPPGISGVIFRHDADPHRAALGWAVAKLCRQRRIALVFAGDGRAAAAHTGIHLRGGHWPAFTRRGKKLITSSAHNGAEIVRARRAGAKLIFISPVFPTLSHQGAAPLGHLSWLRIARLAQPAKACALGGITDQKLKTLSPKCCAAASISALSR